MKLKLTFTKRRTIVERGTVELDEQQVAELRLKFGDDLSADARIEMWAMETMAPRVSKWVADPLATRTDFSFEPEWVE